MKIYVTQSEIAEIKAHCNSRCAHCKWEIACELLDAAPKDWDKDNAIVQARLRKGTENESSDNDKRG